MKAMQNYIWILVLIFVCGYMYGFGKPLLVSAAPYDSCNHTDIYMGTEYSTEHFPMDLLYFAIFSGITSYFVIYSCRMLQGPWSDVYAFAATIYKCVTGVTPPESMERMREDDLKRPWEFGVAISPQVEAALVKGMAAYG